MKIKRTYLILTIVIDLFIFKTNAQANFQWAKSMGGTSNNQGYSIAIDASGNVYTTGTFIGTVDFDPGVGVYTLTATNQEGIFVSKLDAAGNFVWAKNFGGASVFGDMANAIAVDVAGNVYTTGYYCGTEDFDPGPGIYTLSTTSSTNNAFISKLDISGNFVWAKKFGPSYVGGYGLTVDAAGFVYTTGIFDGTIDFDPGAGVYNLTSSWEDIFVSKLDASGAFVWAKQMGGTSAFGDAGYAIAVDATGYVYTTGRFTGTADFDPGAGFYNLTSLGNGDIFVSKLDASGAFVWAKNMGGVSSGGSGYSIVVDVTGNVFTTGSFYGTTDFDPSASVYTLTSAGGQDIFINKLDPSGVFVWAKQMSGTNGDSGYSIAVDAAGSIYTTGLFSDTVDFDPGAGVYNLTSAGQTDVFISKLDASGAFVWAQQIGGTVSDVGNSIAINVAGNVYVTGGFNGTADFDPGVGAYNLTSLGAYDVFVLKLDDGVGIEEILGANDNTISIYPNPSTGNINIEVFGKAEGELQISIIDVTGKNIYTNNIQVSNGNGNFTLDVSEGIYFIEILASKKQLKITKKIIILK